ncbi:peptidoglycan-binding domain-containing protein [Xanthobacteraceae bacterium Astr-EGSB]|uniref:peptidoglycan-binding domain-containing protein n=1 Tax=Astrobacterium formosum TaxID=3069710 RepID=UPI0027B68EDF|nr:peptidoglycan-binding domain-containing protein [Xanthobacteraceae bacterium Astr-EGSB]
MVRNPRDSFLVVAAAGAMTAIVVNGLFLQPGPHPAPLFAVRSPVAASEPTGAIAMPRPRPSAVDVGRREVAPAPTSTSSLPPQAATRTRGDIITDIQRELARRGYYDGAVDGIYGARTDAALREFEQASGVKIGGEMSEATLQAIMHAPAKAKTPLPQPAPRRDAIAELITPAAQPSPPPTVPPAPPVPTPARQLVAVQRVLGDFGYGQVRPTGIYDPETRAAIERFERGRNMPVTGQLSERLVRELGTMSGRPLE